MFFNNDDSAPVEPVFVSRADYYRLARQNEAARAADAAACIDTSVGTVLCVGTVLLKNGWGRR